MGGKANSFKLYQATKMDYAFMHIQNLKLAQSARYI